VIHLYERKAREVAKVLVLAAAIVEAAPLDPIANAFDAIKAWGGPTDEARSKRAEELRDIAAEITAQLGQPEDDPETSPAD
jgi:hypothetical protein